MDYKKKCLYIAFHDIRPGVGVSNKIQSHVQAFKYNGVDTNLLSFSIEDGVRYACIDGEKNMKIGRGIKCKFNVIRLYNKILTYIDEQHVNFIFIRYTQDVDPFYLNFLAKCKRMGVKIIMEIPTYPYDGEFSNQSFILQFQSLIERLFRNQLKNYVSQIVTTSNYDSILGIQTIRISNAVNPSGMPLIVCHDSILQRHELCLISVATISFWHGLDRLIKGIYDYYQSASPKYSIRLLIVGSGDPNVISEIKHLIDKYKLSESIIMLGPRYGNELIDLYNQADIAVGCLACFRKNIKEVKSLKNVEYAMRGLPFFYSEDNSDFDGKPYVLKVPSDESNIVIEDIIKFCINNHFIPSDIRNSVCNLTWNEQIKKIIERI